MNASAAIADPLLRRTSGQRARPSDPHRTAQVRIGSSVLRALVSRRGSAISRRIVMNNAGKSRNRLIFIFFWPIPCASERRLIDSKQVKIQWGHGDNSFEIAIHTPQREVMQESCSGNQKIRQRNALAFSGKLVTQAGCPLPCLVQNWGLFERRQLFIEDRPPFWSFDADEQFCSNRPTYPHRAGYKEFSQSILQSVMALAIRTNPNAGVDEARPDIKSGHACDGGESGTRLRWFQRLRCPVRAPTPCDALVSQVPQGLWRWSLAWSSIGSIVLLRPEAGDQPPRRVVWSCQP